MKKINLYDTVGFGIIINTNSGVLYSNQTGGTSCLRPETEGVYISLRNDYLTPQKEFQSPEIKLAEYFEGLKYGGTGALHGIDNDDVDFIQSVFKAANLSEYITVDIDRLQQSHEAWIYCLITQDNELFQGFSPYPCSCIVTWANSD